MKKKQIPVYFVEWEDSSTTYGWNEPQVDETTVIRSVGILVSRTPRSVTLSTSHSRGGRFADQISIPTSCIRKIKRIKF